MIIEFVLLIWCIAITGLLITVIHCQNNQSEIIDLINMDLNDLRQCVAHFTRKGKKDD